MANKNKHTKPAEVDPVLSFKWVDINEQQPPNDVQILVRLEREMLGGFYQTAIFGRISIIGSLFSWDAPKPTHWTYIVD